MIAQATKENTCTHSLICREKLRRQITARKGLLTLFLFFFFFFLFSFSFCFCFALSDYPIYGTSFSTDSNILNISLEKLTGVIFGLFLLVRARLNKIFDKNRFSSPFSSNFYFSNRSFVWSQHNFNCTWNKIRKITYFPRSMTRMRLQWQLNDRENEWTIDLN